MHNLSYRHHPGEEPLKYIILGQLAEVAAIKYKNVIAIDSVEQNIKLTFLEVLNEADKFASGLNELGMQKGDKLGLWAYNCLEWYVVNLACIRAGFLIVPLNPANATSEMEYSIKKVGIKFIVCPFEGLHNKFYDILMEIAPELRNVNKTRFFSHNLPSLKGIVLISEQQFGNAYNYKDVIELGNRNSKKENGIGTCQNGIDPDDACYIHFSSGTTGKPKAILLSHFQVINNSYVTAKRCELDQKHHSICVQIPLFHAFATITTISSAMHFGATLVLPSMYYSPIKNFEAVIAKRCSSIIGTPTMYIDLISIQEITPKELNLEVAILGAAPCSPELFKNIGSVLNIKNIKMSYGLTETSTGVFMSIPGEQQGYDTVGYICDHLQVKVVDKNGKTLALGEPGEIYVRGYAVMLGYYDDEENTTKIIQRDGWLKTGDIGVLQSNGHAKIVGRTTDLIIRGGENIYPKEIEDFLSTHPSILEVQVIGVPHQRLGEEVCACIRVRRGFELTKSELIEFCKNKIAHFKVPTQLTIVHTFPKTLTGKIQKHLLKEQICNGLLR